MPYVWVPKNKQSEPKDTVKENPTPSQLVPQFNRNLSLGSSSSSSNVNNSYKKNDNRQLKFRFVYGNKATGMWFSVGLANEYHIPSTVTLKEVSLPYALRRGNKVLLVLVNDEEVKKTIETVRDGPRLKSPWETIAENVLDDIISSFHNLKTESNSQNIDELNPGFLVRFGKILFHGNRSFHPHTNRKRLVSENALKNLSRNFYTTVPPSYVDNITAHVAPENGFDTKVEKESYRIKLADTEQPDATITCECKVTADGERMELYKLEMNQVRHLVVDVTCFGKDLDMRLMLRTKRNVNTLNEKEMQSIRHLISSAVLDSNVKGGLRWPIGMACDGLNYRVAAVWHSKRVTYKKSSMRLRMRDVDRFDYRSSSGDFSPEVVLKLCGICSKLKEANPEDDLLFDMLKENFKMIWEHLLDCNDFLKLEQILS